MKHQVEIFQEEDVATLRTEINIWMEEHSIVPISIELSTAVIADAMGKPFVIATALVLYEQQMKSVK
jgi:hypothetical protein